MNQLKIATRICANKKNLAHALTVGQGQLENSKWLEVTRSVLALFVVQTCSAGEFVSQCPPYIGEVDFAKPRYPRRMHFGPGRLLSNHRPKTSHCEQMDKRKDELLADPSSISWTFPSSHKSKSG